MQNNHFNELAIKNNIETGKKLRAIRNLLVRKPEEITTNLVNDISNKTKPSLRKMAKILITLKDYEKSRSNVFSSIGMINDSNNVIRTISVLEKLNLIRKTKLAPKSSRQKYKLTEKGSPLLQELDML
ncbi:hypothetical protein [Sphingobacterium sp. MYb388]|uniref:hypothetical protein n=1 Tax=Sphingobacterium sp. MYb388 TaxID=2745437 RepID=UPI0030B069A4